MLESLEQYLSDCENKRRRARDRPSNQVLEDLRVLLEAYRAVTSESASARESLEASPSDPETADVSTDLDSRVH